MRFQRFLAATSVASAISALAFIGLPAQAANPKIDVYLSAPQVEGSYVSGAGVYVSDFNSGCTFAMGTLANPCTTRAVSIYGGAETTSSTPVTTTGGTGSNYVSGTDGAIELTMTKPARYVGFWWSAGSGADTVTFYKNNVELIQITTADIVTLLNNPTVTAINTTAYDSYKYYGNPRLGSGTAAGSGHGGASPDEPFAFLHLILTGGASFDKVVLSGGGFEFDNFTTAELAPEVDPSLAQVKSETLPAASLDAQPELADTGAAQNGFAAGLGLIALLTGAGALAFARKTN